MVKSYQKSGKNLTKENVVKFYHKKMWSNFTTKKIKKLTNYSCSFYVYFTETTLNIYYIMIYIGYDNCLW